MQEIKSHLSTTWIGPPKEEWDEPPIQLVQTQLPLVTSIQAFAKRSIVQQVSEKKDRKKDNSEPNQTGMVD